MITHGGPQEIWCHDRIRELGLTEEYFYSLPYEYQRALMMASFDTFDKEKKLNDLRKRMALKQYNFEEKVKEKVLTIFKKNK